MSDRNRVSLSVLVGAFAGGVVGFLLFTEQGRRIREELQPHLDELQREVRNLQEMAMKVRDTAGESWKQIEGLMGELGQQGGSWTHEARRH